MYYDSLFASNKTVKMNKSYLTTFLKNHQHKNLIEKDLEIVEQKLKSR